MATVAADGGVRRLAQYRPFERGGLDLRAVLHDLVIAVAALEGGEVESLLSCRKAFDDCWGVVVEVDELRPVVEGLIDAGLAEKSGQGFRLSPALLAELEQKANTSQKAEDRAFREWKLAVQQAHPTLSDNEVDVLQGDLREWLHLIITRHGAEAALMLYPEEERAREFFDAIDAQGFEALPQRDAGLLAAREQALPLFVRQPTPEQRTFLAGLLNTTFYMTVLTIDPGARQLVEEQLRGHIVYLDTNFLYAVLGAAPIDEVYSARRLVQLTLDLGIDLAMTPWTTNELHTSIDRSRRDVESQSSFVRPELAQTMLRASGDKGFKRYFWQTYHDKKTKPKDFFDRLDHFEGDLERYGIKERTEGCTAIEQQAERIKLYTSLLNSERWRYPKEWVVLEHDAKCRLLVERLRGNGRIRFSNARVWFLTYDTKLPRFAERVPDNEDVVPELPFCISPSAWIQVIRALTPRTDDFGRTMVDLLTSPFVGYRRAINQTVVQEVVGRIDNLEDASPEMALEVLADGAKVDQIEAATGSGDEEAIEEVVSSAYASKTRELHDAVKASEERAAQAAEAAARAQAEATKAARDRERERANAEALQADLDSEKTARAEEARELRSQVEDVRQEKSRASVDTKTRVQGLEDRLDREKERRRRDRRIAAGAALALIGVLIAVCLPLLLVHGSGGVIGAIVGGSALSLLGARIAVGQKWGGELLIWLTLVVTLAGVVTAFVFGANHR
jgi:hypothetical protein